MSADQPLDTLRADPANRRQHPARNVDMLTAALQSVGAARSIVIDEDDTVLAGNGVVEAAQRAGISKVRSGRRRGRHARGGAAARLTDTQKRDLALFDNRTAELAEWDVQQLQADADAGLGLERFFFPDELAKLGVVVPTFGAADVGEQGTLASTQPIVCPHCGRSFTVKLDWCGYDAARYAVEHWHYSKSLPTRRSCAWASGRARPRRRRALRARRE